MAGGASPAMVPYRLSALTEGRNRLICASGPPKVLKHLLRVQGAERRRAGDKTFVALPASRTNIMVAEACGVAASAHEVYLAMRNELMRPDDRVMAEWARAEPALAPAFLEEARANGWTVPTAAQRQFCALAYKERGFLNASEQGTGKTLTAAMLIKAWGSRRALVVVPTRDLTLQWQKEVYRYLADPPLFVPLLDGNAKERSAMMRHMEESAGGGQLVVAVNYDMLRHMERALVAWRPDAVVLDEAWMIKNHKSARSRAAIAIADEAVHVLALNGTPWGQDPTDMWPQMRAVDPGRGDMMETPDEWRDAYATVIQMNVGKYSIPKAVGVKDPVGLVSRVAPRFFRATKASSLDLPEKLPPVKVELQMDQVASRLYALCSERGDALFNPLSLNGDRVAAIRMQQLTSGTCPPIESEDGRAVHDGGVVPSVKREWVRDWAEATLAGDPTYRAIVWCKFTATIHVLEQALIDILGEGRVFTVTSKTADRALDAAKDSFNSRDPDGVQLFVAQTKKFAYGHNLQACDWNVLFDHSWSYIERDQLEDRSHRAGRVGPVGYTELLAMWLNEKARGGPKWQKTVDHEILNAFEKREDYGNRFGPDTTGSAEDW